MSRAYPVIGEFMNCVSLLTTQIANSLLVHSKSRNRAGPSHCLSFGHWVGVSHSTAPSNPNCSELLIGIFEVQMQPSAER